MKKHENKKTAMEKVGKVSVFMYKEKDTNLPIFKIRSENEDVLQVSYIIEDALYNFR